MKRFELIRKGHMNFFGFDFQNFRLVSINLALNSALVNQTDFCQKGRTGTENSNQN